MRASKDVTLPVQSAFIVVLSIHNHLKGDYCVCCRASNTLHCGRRAALGVSRYNVYAGHPQLRYMQSFVNIHIHWIQKAILWRSAMTVAQRIQMM
jgi:hypothetical protein